VNSRLAFSPMLQRCYAKIRRVPIFGDLAHGFIGRILPSGTHVTVTVHTGLAAGLSLSIDPRYEADYAAGVYEDALLECLASHLEMGHVFYDVGAHIGFVALVGARLVGTEGRVFAFEADPGNSSRVLEHARMNAFPQIDVIESAVWSKCTTLPFRRAGDASSRNTGAVMKSPDSHAIGQIISIPAVTLDRFAEQHRAPNVIKVDVEGAESEVLKGAQKIFRDSKPVLICEIHDSIASETVSEWLVNCGYRWDWMLQGRAFPRHLVAQPGT